MLTSTNVLVASLLEVSETAYYLAFVRLNRCSTSFVINSACQRTFTNVSNNFSNFLIF